MRGLCFAVSGILAMTPGQVQAAPLSVGTVQFRAELSAPDVRLPILLVQALSDDFSVADVMGAPGTPIALAIFTGRGGSNSDLFALSGLPQVVKLSAGGRRNHYWIVRQKDISSLTLTAPPGFSGAFRVSVTRAPTPQRPGRTLTFTVNIYDDREDTRATVANTSTNSAPPGSTILREIPSYVPTPEEKMLFERADGRLKAGDIGGARSIFEYLAAKGNAAAAFAVGSTYDPLYLEKLFIAGVEGNAKKALEWYRKADKLGNLEAQARLNSLRQR